MKAKYISLLLSLPIALLGTAAIAQQVREEICQLNKNPHPTTTNLPQPSTRKVDSPSPFSEAEAAVKAGNYAQAETIWRREIQSGANYASAYFELGETLRFQQKFEEAISTYRKVIELNPSYGAACAGWVQAAFKSVKPYISGLEDYPSREQGSTYIECARLRIKLQPDNYEHYEYIGLIWFAIGKYNDAITAWLQAIQLLPCDVDFFKAGRAVGYLPEALLRKSRLDEILPIYDKLIRRYPMHAATLYIRKGNALVELKRPKEAIEAFRKSIELDPYGREYARVLIKEAEQMLKSR